jgi:hypothetical protein
MPKKFNASQFKSQIRKIENQQKQQIRKVNQEIDKYNRNVKRAVSDYNRAVRQHNSKVRQSRSRIDSELRRLKNSSETTITNTYRTSVISVNNSYNVVAETHDYLESPTPFQDYVYSGIEQENANNLETANILFGEPLPLESPVYALQETNIMNRLSAISKDLDDRWRGALFSLNPANPDATRHFCTSTREIFTEIFESKATDNDVFSVFPNCEKTPRGNATRKEKIRYFLHKKGIQDSDVNDFVDKDMQNILELFHVLSAGTHGEAGKYTFEVLSSVKKRVEDGLIFLCDIAA